MPTYGYRCTNCGHQFEIFQRMSDDSLKVCPNCGQATLKTVVYPAGVVFKGSGFYKTDSRSGGKRSSKPKEKESTSSSDSSSSSSSSTESSSSSPKTDSKIA